MKGKGSSWFRFGTPQMADDGGERSAVRVDIFGEIGWDVSGTEFLRELKALGDDTELHLRIHSPGGSVLDGWAVANGIAHHKGRVTARVEGMAASMASIIMRAADHVEIPENAYVMIHNVSGGAWGNAEELQSAAELIDKLQADIASFYARRTGQELEVVEAAMAAETWFNGAEAVAWGLADEVLQPVAAAAVAEGIDPDSLHNRFQHVPEALENVGGKRGGKPDPAEGGEDEAPAAEDEGEAVDPPIADEADPGEPPVTEEEAAADAAEEAGEEEPTATAEGEETPRGIIQTFLASLRQRSGAGPDAAAALATAQAENTRLRAELEEHRQRADQAETERATLRQQVEELRTEQRDVAAVIAECGFTPAEAAELPAAADVESEQVPAGAWERFQQMPDGPERTKFFKENKAAILAGQSAASRVPATA